MRKFLQDSSPLFQQRQALQVYAVNPRTPDELTEDFNF